MKKTDIEEVSKLFFESYAKESKNMRWKEAYALRYISVLYRVCKALCFVAVDGNKVIGCALSSITPEYDHDILEFKILLVHPKFRRQKVGTKLMRKTCLKAANNFNIDVVETGLHTHTNFPVIWYESIGFRTRKDYEMTRGSIDKILNTI